jgi:hypothetical protein
MLRAACMRVSSCTVNCAHSSSTTEQHVLLRWKFSGMPAWRSPFCALGLCLLVECRTDPQDPEAEALHKGLAVWLTAEHATCPLRTPDTATCAAAAIRTQSAAGKHSNTCSGAVPRPILMVYTTYSLTTGSHCSHSGSTMVLLSHASLPGKCSCYMLLAINDTAIDLASNALLLLHVVQLLLPDPAQACHIIHQACSSGSSAQPLQLGSAEAAAAATPTSSSKQLSSASMHAAVQLLQLLLQQALGPLDEAGACGGGEEAAPGLQQYVGDLLHHLQEAAAVHEVGAGSTCSGKHACFLCICGSLGMLHAMYSSTCSMWWICCSTCSSSARDRCLQYLQWQARTFPLFLFYVNSLARCMLCTAARAGVMKVHRHKVGTAAQKC